MPGTGFEPLSDVRATLGESPVWSPVHAAVWWVDITGRRLIRTGLDGASTVWPTPEVPGFVQCVEDAVFVGMQSGIFRFDLETGAFDRTASIEATSQRFNDACTDSRGRIWAGTMDLENSRDDGVLYLFDPVAGTLVPKAVGFRTINGLAWDERRRRLFLSDSHPEVQTVWTAPLGPEDALGTRSEFARFHDRIGRPDGAALDLSGHYWIAGVGGGTVYRFAPDGELAQTFEVPVRSPTKPAFLSQEDTPVLVLTSFEDEGVGGRLLMWKIAADALTQESPTR